MAELGRLNQLQVLRETRQGLYLDGGESGDILLPNRYVPRGLVAGSTVEVFIYRDSEDRIIATTETPLAFAGDYAFLKVVGVQPDLGAFLDWGLSKDLLLPRREQRRRLREGESILVKVLVDEKSNRIIASTRLNHWQSQETPNYKTGQAVQLLIAEPTDLGYYAVIENAHMGLLYRSEIPQALQIGQRIQGYVRTVREDGKIDLSLDQAGYVRVKPLSDQILEALAKAGGSLPLHDKSSPEEIREMFGVSKKAFKQALGALYRNRRVILEEREVRLVAPTTRKNSSKSPSR